MFNPQTLYLASKNKAFRDLVNKTAIDAVENSFNVELDRSNLKFPKLSYKGVPKAAVIRKKSENPPETIESSPIDAIYPPLSQEKSAEPKTKVGNIKDEPPIAEYAVPKHQIIERHSVGLANELDMKSSIERPKELLVTIDLPLLNSCQDMDLDVSNNKIYLVSEKPAKYKTQIKLPFNVDEKNGNAKFEKAKRQLLITLPIVMEMKQTNFDNVDCENDQNQETDDKEIEYEQQIVKDEDSNDDEFWEDNVDYILPHYSLNQMDEVLAFTLHVKSCSNDSIEIKRCDEKNLAMVKFCTVGSGEFFFFTNLWWFLDRIIVLK